MAILEIDEKKIRNNIPELLMGLGFKEDLSDSNRKSWYYPHYTSRYGLELTIKQGFWEKEYDAKIKTKRFEANCTFTKVDELIDWFEIQTRGLLILAPHGEDE